MMKNELVLPVEITIKDKKKTISGKIRRAAVFAASKVLEAITSDNEQYYLIYFKNSFVFGDKLLGMKEGSFIHQVFQQGLVIEETSPLLSNILPSTPVTIPNRNKLFSSLRLHFNPQEIAYIATMLDSFFEKTDLVKIIEQIYYLHRRNGKFFKAYQILQILTQFNPQQSSITDRMASLEFHSYHSLYKPSNLSALYLKDPLFVEQYCYKNRANPDINLFLEENLFTQESYPEIILLWLERVHLEKKIESVEKYTKLALKCLTLRDWIAVLVQDNINPFQVLPEAKTVMEEMVKQEQYEAAALSLVKFIDDLPLTYDSILQSVWENLEPEFVLTHLDDCLAMLQKRPGNKDLQKSEKQIFQLIVNMLNGLELKIVYEKLKPFQHELYDSTWIRKLEKMVSIVENPDQMMELGDYYAEFNQFDQAIDCYFWEMELKPQDPAPLRRLSKMYQKKGLLKEASAYQKLLGQLGEQKESV